MTDNTITWGPTARGIEPHAFVPSAGDYTRWCEVCDHSADSYAHASEAQRAAFDQARAEIPYDGSYPRQVDWDKTDVAALDEHNRDMLIYKVAAEVARSVGGISAWRTQRSGTCIGVWFGPERQRSRRADYDVWIESTADQHLHRLIAQEVYREVRNLMRDHGDPEHDTIAAVPFGATLDQVMIERFGLTEAQMAGARGEVAS